MKDEMFKNGALLFKLWPDGSNELLAALQYEEHAKELAGALADGTVSDERPLPMFVVINQYDMRMTAVRVPVSAL